jgi:hypothetical protein
VIASQAVAQLTAFKDKPTQPFFYALGFKRPHLSYRAPSKYFEM